MSDKKTPTPYKKHHSFEHLRGTPDVSIDRQRQRAIAALAQPIDTPDWMDPTIAQEARTMLLADDPDSQPFRITSFIADDLSTLADHELPTYLLHRFRYDVFPQRRQLDDYPPCMQVEPSSVCNFRCVFCYQTDSSFSRKSTGFMGTIELDLWKRIVDQAEGNIHFLTLASRGEPLVCRDLPEMLKYARGKFLGLKLNTNASMLTEELCHDILQAGVRNLVFSADAAKEPDYSRFRVGGSLERTVANVRKLKEIRDRDYPDSKTITRVSGVFFDPEHQSFQDLLDYWGELVDEVTFVAYNPWESVYDTPANDLETPCSDLWRRMFVWYDGKANPCDTDYKSTLSMGTVQEHGVHGLWRSNQMEKLRLCHDTGKRQTLEPCRRCMVT